MKKEAILYKTLKGKETQCLNCAHYCVLQENQTGICGTRKNIGGKIFSLNYGKICALDIDPIEKKPLFHFLPGSSILSLASVGCNFSCASCQNWQISQISEMDEIFGEEFTPQEIVNIACQKNLKSIAYTYTEPTVFSDFALETMKLAKEKGIKNVWVSNGFWSKELFETISPFLDAANIDLKSFEDEFYIRYCGARLQPVLDTLKRIVSKKIWLEITTLVIPTLNDKEEIFKEIAHFIKKELKPEIPWHITRFSGALSWKLKNLPDTPPKTLLLAREIGLKEGLKYVYTGNIPGLEGEDTFCPKCGAKIIERFGYNIKRYDKQGKCPKCGTKIDLILE
ncbi:AmmeMemoRadiSam system radical SAM enzyme [bacterium]|nr:AmmeMemoRadiSam system radical SAM enzyme [bacterium]